jgi:hypothetical protein
MSLACRSVGSITRAIRVLYRSIIRRPHGQDKTCRRVVDAAGTFGHPRTLHALSWYRFSRTMQLLWLRDHVSRRRSVGALAQAVTSTAGEARPLVDRTDALFARTVWGKLRQRATGRA